ncbi:hypothetical protein OMK64_03655 [Cellulomonas fimi]|nr:hypothetical protein [Cellulomonas fimi]
MFGGRARSRAGPLPGADQEAELPLTVEEAYRGGRRQITLNGPDGPRQYTVTIPPGVTEGRRIRLAGEGGRGAGDGPAGDLYLVVRLQPHPLFDVDGKDITVPLKVAPWEATLGTAVPVPTPGGDRTVTVPAGSSSGRRLRLRGEGRVGGRSRVLWGMVLANRPWLLLPGSSRRSSRPWRPAPSPRSTPPSGCSRARCRGGASSWRRSPPSRSWWGGS